MNTVTPDQSNAIRSATAVRADGGGSLRAQQILNLDQSVAEVFLLMMGSECIPEEAVPECSAGPTVTAVVGLAGMLSGACILRMEMDAALAMAGLMVGAACDRFDALVKDALGEVCNMLAGTWKGKLEAISPHCMLSVPAVVSGRSYELHVQETTFRLDRAYRFGPHKFLFSIGCKGL